MGRTWRKSKEIDAMIKRIEKRDRKLKKELRKYIPKEDESDE
jgi:hypothetical protein